MLGMLSEEVMVPRQIQNYIFLDRIRNAQKLNALSEYLWNRQDDYHLGFLRIH
jgi:hypothetical protein